MPDNDNPYSPPSLQAVNKRKQCPACGQRVQFARYAFPFGHCPECKNYLAISNQGRSKWLWHGSFFFAVPLFYLTPNVLGANADSKWLLLALAWCLACWCHEKVVGQLVPAACWGFVARPDDVRSEADNKEEML